MLPKRERERDRASERKRDSRNICVLFLHVTHRFTTRTQTHTLTQTHINTRLSVWTQAESLILTARLLNVIIHTCVCIFIFIYIYIITASLELLIHFLRVHMTGGSNQTNKLVLMSGEKPRPHVMMSLRANQTETTSTVLILNDYRERDRCVKT